MLDALLSISLLLIAAKIIEGLAGRVRQNSLVAYVLTGVLLGPILGIVEPSAELALFFGVGIIFLFFLIGVDEIDIPGFVSTLRGRFFLAAAIAFLVPFGCGLAVTLFLLDLNPLTCIAISGILSLSSLGVVAKVLSDLGHLQKPLGLQIFTTVAIVELVGLLLVGISLQRIEATNDISGWRIAILLGQMIVFAVIGWLLASRVIPPLIIRLKQLLGISQLAFGLLVATLFLVAVGAEHIGLHPSLGALLFGIALSGLPNRLRHEVMPGMRSIGHGLFIPLFFASAGLHLDLSFTALPMITIVSIILVAVMGKSLGAILATQLTRLNAPFAIASGIMGKGVIEIALLLALLEAKAITPEFFSLLTLIMMGFLLIVPSVIDQTVRRATTTEKSPIPRFLLPSFARYALESVIVEDVLIKDRDFARNDMSINDFTEQWLVPEQQDYLIVTDEGKLFGILSLHQLQKVPKDQWSEKTLGNLVKYDRHRVPHVLPNEPLDDVLDMMTRKAVTVVPVIDPETRDLLGSVTSRDVLARMVGDGEYGGTE